MGRFSAPWCMALYVITIFSGLLLAGLAGWMLFAGAPLWAPPLVLAALGGSALFAVRGYRVESGALWVERPFWTTEIRLDGVEWIKHDPKALHGSLRTFGNGGLFSFSGRYWSKALGSYRAWVTDPKRSVILKVKGKTIVVSPDEPGKFIKAVEGMR